MKAEVLLAYTLLERQVLTACHWTEGMTAGDAWLTSGMGETLPDIGPHPEFGRNGLRIEWATLVKAGDRIDILRPLLITALEARRRRAAVQSRRQEERQK